MTCDALYTKEELIQKLRDLDEQMDAAETQSKIETGQSQHEFRVSIRTLREQYEKYSAMLQRSHPDCYRAIFGSSVTRFSRTNDCRHYGGYRCR